MFSKTGLVTGSVSFTLPHENRNPTSRLFRLQSAAKGCYKGIPTTHLGEGGQEDVEMTMAVF